jgi:hypothetical protein
MACASASVAESPSKGGTRIGHSFPQHGHHGQPVSEDFVALITHWYFPWPSVPFHTFRLWDTNTFWSTINTGAGQYDWTVVDAWLEAASENQAEPLFTLGMTPQWASSDPNNTICHVGPGQCAPPDDLNPDGSGTDQHWKDFLTAAAQHVGTQVQYWEIWNEPNNRWYWLGTYAQLARMAQDARSVILSVNPNAKFLNAGTGGQRPYALEWWRGYGRAGGFQWADIIALHGDVRPYPPKCGVYPEPETFLVVASNVRRILKKFGQENKAIWDTESSWGPIKQDCFTNQDLQAAFLARFYLLHLSEGLQRFYWRGWIDGDGGIFDKNNGHLYKAGVAYEQISSWLPGNTMTRQCSKTPRKGTIWTCNFAGPKHYRAEAIWDTSQTCKKGQCGTTPYHVGGNYVDYLTLDGTKEQIQNHTVPVGAKPIWVEN